MVKKSKGTKELLTVLTNTPVTTKLKVEKLCKLNLKYKFI